MKSSDASDKSSERTDDDDDDGFGRQSGTIATAGKTRSDPMSHLASAQFCRQSWMDVGDV